MIRMRSAPRVRRPLWAEYRADQIEMALAGRAPARVTGGSVTPRCVRFRVVPAPGVGVRQVAREIAVRLGRGVRVRTWRREGVVEVEIPGDEGETISLVHLVANLIESPRLTAVLGLDEDAAPLLWRLATPGTGHMLVAGPPGSGKTTLLQAMIISLAMLNWQRELQFILAGGLSPLHGLPHLLWPWLTVAPVHQAVCALKCLLGDMIAARQRDGVQWPHLVIVVDGLDSLGEEQLNMVLNLLDGGHATTHVMATTRSPDGGDLREHFPVMVTANGRPGAFRVATNGHSLFFQAAMVTAEEMAQVAAKLRAGGRKSRRWSLEELQPTRSRWQAIRSVVRKVVCHAATA